MNPLLSVVTPIFNCEEYLKDSIESALSQTFEDFEFIIVNDGSTDSSKDIALSFKDDRIRFIDNSDNKKIPTRRNEAIRSAVGKYIAIHDGDDISLSTRFKEQVDILEADNIFCVGSLALKIDLDSKDIGEMTYPPENHHDILSMVTRKCMNPIIDPTTIFRRDFFIFLGEYTLDKMIYTVPDFDLWLRAINHGMKFYNIQKPLIKYRVNPDGMTRQHKQEMIRSHMMIWRKFMSERQKPPLRLS